MQVLKYVLIAELVIITMISLYSLSKPRYELIEALNRSMAYTRLQVKPVVNNKTCNGVDDLQPVVRVDHQRVMFFYLTETKSKHLIGVNILSDLACGTKEGTTTATSNYSIQGSR